MNIKTDIVILGGGIAALQAARKLSTRFAVHILTKEDFTHSSTFKAQGGIAAVLAPNDAVTLHTNDTLTAGENHHHLGNVNTLIKHGQTCMRSLLNCHFPADKTDKGELALGLEGAHSRHRIVHAGGDATGKHLINQYMQHIKQQPSIHISTYTFAYELLLNVQGECCGVRVKTAQGIKTYYASYVILATGGAGALYSYTSNHIKSFGDGIALAYLAGAEITDMEFVQFHPSLLYKDGAHGLISEAVRGAGGRFVDKAGTPVMDGKHALGDLAPRHITAFEMYNMRAQGQEVFLDISMIEHFENNFPTITQLCTEQQIDLTDGKIPITPGSHFLMGGVIATAEGQTSIPRLLAVGEVACTGVHGANRLASNSLLEGLAFGDLMASHLLLNFQQQQHFIVVNQHSKHSLPPLLPVKSLQQKMFAAAGIVRTTTQLEALLQQLPVNYTPLDLSSFSVEEIEQYFMHITASLIVQAALLRTESRGAHIRSGFPQKAEWQHKWIVFKNGNVNVRDTLYECNQINNNATAIF